MSKNLWLLTGPLGQNAESENGALRRWLARGQVSHVDDRQSTAARILGVLGHGQLNPDRAAFRYRAHAESTAWVAAADPVYLEPRLDHLCLYSCTVTSEELEQLCDHLNSVLADDGTWSLEIQGGELYFLGADPVPTSRYPTAAISGLLPNKFMPVGEDAADYRRRLSEFEMALHEHPVNLTRIAEGRHPVNSLWLWGGGRLPEMDYPVLPRLVSNDSHLRGFWRAAGAESRALPEQLAVTELHGDTVIGPISDRALPATLEALRAALRSGDADTLCILSLDGYVIRHRRRDWMRFFRRPHKDFS